LANEAPQAGAFHVAKRIAEVTAIEKIDPDLRGAPIPFFDRFIFSSSPCRLDRSCIAEKVYSSHPLDQGACRSTGFTGMRRRIG
jgi:hypothetical protein